jgi:hypothetical protein
MNKDDLDLEGYTEYAVHLASLEEMGYELPELVSYAQTPLRAEECRLKELAEWCPYVKAFIARRKAARAFADMYGREYEEVGIAANVSVALSTMERGPPETVQEVGVVPTG